DIFPKSAAEAHAAVAAVAIPPGAPTFSGGLRNTGARNPGFSSSGGGTPQTPLANVFELAASSPTSPVLSGSLRAADLQYVGLTNVALTQSVSNTVVFFGFSTYAP